LTVFDVVIFLRIVSSFVRSGELRKLIVMLLDKSSIAWMRLELGRCR